MRFPKTLKIGGHSFKVILKKSWDGSDDEAGYCDTDKNEIVIKSTLPQTQKEGTLIHEIFHALNSTIDHPLLDSLSEQFYQVMADNKLLK